MKVLLISANTERINMPTLPLGLGCVAEATRQAGHEIRMLDLIGAANPQPPIREAIHDFSPDIIAISIRNIDDQKMEGTRLLLDQVKEIISECRSQSKALIVLGGAGYSIFPESALEYLEADMGIQGEGEDAFVKLLDRLQSKSSLSETPGLYVRGKGLQGERTFVQDLNTLPLPNIDLWNPSYAKDPEFWMPVQTRRGCAMDCSYCSTGTIEGRALRRRSPRNVIRWMKDHFDKGFHRFFFTDNIFNLPPSYAKKLCEEILTNNMDISWRCIIYPIRLEEDLARIMAEAGCAEVALGAESGSEQILLSLNKRFKPDDIRHTADLLKKHNIRRTGFLLLGSPGETRETAEEGFAFADSLGLDMMKITIGVRIYPYTQLARTAVEEGVIDPDDDLLYPKFYFQRDLEDWLRKTVDGWLEKRSNWFM